jgi:hypothetical protein
MIDVSNLGLGDKITNEQWGIGTVTQCNESPAVYVNFKQRGKVLYITEKDAEHFNHA